jgi:ribosomal protein S18 acetylase RimI-like enzyme
MRIERATAVDDELVGALARLMPQLSSSAAAPSRDHLEALVADERTALLVARDDADGRILGSLTLASYRIPTAHVAWIEDVVVDEAARGRGVGEALTEEAKRLATEWGATAVRLTSRPAREAANRLYARLGFERHETNAYRWRPRR